MKQFSRIVRAAFFAYRIDPLCYVLSIASVLVCAIRFFLAFFSLQGTCDLRPLFSAVPYVSILTVPLLVFRIRALITDDSLPIPSFTKFCALTTASFCMFALPLVLLLTVPLCVQSFGDVELGQLLAGYAGVLLYGFTACALCVFLFALCAGSNENSIGIMIPLFVSVLVLFLTNMIHKVPLYVKTGAFLSYVLQKLSFAWHFDAAGKGIFDSSDVFFYVFTSCALLLLATCIEYVRTGRAIQKLTVVLLLLSFLFASIFVSRLHVRIDITGAQRFTLSRATKTMLQELEAPLRITYYRSKELKQLYPQTNDVAAFLELYAQEKRQVSLTITAVDEKQIRELQNLGIQGRQIRSATTAKTEFLTVYSAVVLQYIDKELIIPFVLSTETLEYDITRRLQELVTDSVRTVYIVLANERVTDYDYVSGYLETRGFMPLLLTPQMLTQLTPVQGSEIVVLGSSLFDVESCAALEHFVKTGVPAFIAVSPYEAAVEADWTVQRSASAPMLSMLASWGFGFESALVQDIACFPLSLQSGEGSDAEYQRINYPLWVSLLPQPAAPNGATVFWASPLTLYGDAEPLLVTTAESWLQQEGTGADNAFVTNPFLVAKSAKAAGVAKSQYVCAARIKDDGAISGYYAGGKSPAKVAVVADQYFVSSLMTAYISAESAGDFRNFDFMLDQLLQLRGDAALANLLHKKSSLQSLYKITDSAEFESTKLRSLILVLGFLPLLIIACACISARERSKKAKARGAKK